MAALAQIWSFLFGFFPAWFQIIILVLFVVLINLLIFRLIALILDALPFV